MTMTRSDLLVTPHTLPPDSPDSPDSPEGPVEQLWRRWRQNQCRDFDDPETGTAPNPAQVLAVLRYDQLHRWRGGERRAAERYVEAHSLLRTDAEHALVFIYGELLLSPAL